MAHYGQVLEDPDYYDEVDDGWDEEEFVDDVDFITEMELFNPFNTVNS